MSHSSTSPITIAGVSVVDKSVRMHTTSCGDGVATASANVSQFTIVLAPTPSSSVHGVHALQHQFCLIHLAPLLRHMHTRLHQMWGVCAMPRLIRKEPLDALGAACITACHQTRATCILLFVVCMSSDCDSHTAQHNTGPCTLETLSLIHSFDPAFTRSHARTHRCFAFQAGWHHRTIPRSVSR